MSDEKDESELQFTYTYIERLDCLLDLRICVLSSGKHHFYNPPYMQKITKI